MRTNTKGIGPGRLALRNIQSKAALPTEWRTHGACNTGNAKRDIEIFFDEDPERALKRCTTCTVRPTCLAYALLNDERWGVWGGTTQEERHDLHEKPASVILRAVEGALPVLFEHLKKRSQRH